MSQLIQPEVLTLTAFSFRRQPTPLDEDGRGEGRISKYRGVFNIKNIRAEFLKEKNASNMRDPNVGSAIAKDIRESLVQSPELFVVKHSGITILAESVDFDTKTNDVKITFLSTKEHGVINGGHSVSVIHNFLESEEAQQMTADAFVELEIITGFTDKDTEAVIQVIDARNNSASMPDYASEEKRNAYNPIKKAFEGQPYENLICYRPGQTDDEGNARPINIREVLQYLALLDVQEFDEQTHPTRIYAGAANAVKHFIGTEGELRDRIKQMAPLLPKIMELRDRVHKDIKDLYNNAGGNYKLLRGTQTRGPIPLHFIDDVVDFDAPKPYLMPIVAAFRNCVGFDGATYRWIHDPFTVYDRAKTSLGHDLRCALSDADDPQTLGKKPLFWRLCHQTVANKIGVSALAI